MRAVAVALCALAATATGARATSFILCNEGTVVAAVAVAYRTAATATDMTTYGWQRISPGACVTLAATRGGWLEVLFAVRQRIGDAWQLAHYHSAAGPPLGTLRPGAERPETYAAEVFACFPDTDFSGKARLSGRNLGSCEPAGQVLLNQRSMVVGRWDYTLSIR